MAGQPNDDPLALVYVLAQALTAVPVVPFPPTLSGTVETLSRGSVDYLINVTARTATALHVVPQAMSGTVGQAPMGYFQPRVVGPISELDVFPLHYEIDISVTGFYWIRDVPVVGSGQRLELSVTGGGATATVTVTYFRKGAAAQGSSPAVFG